MDRSRDWIPDSRLVDIRLKLALSTTWFVWICLFAAGIAIVIILLLILLFCHYTERTTVVRFPEDNPVEISFGTAINSKGMIHPSVRFYEKRPSNSSSGIESGCPSRRGSSFGDFHLPGNNQVAPVSSPFLIDNTFQELDPTKLSPHVRVEEKARRKGSFHNINDEDTFDTVSSDFTNNPDVVPTPVKINIERLSTPLRPLTPAYQAIEPLQMSRIPQALSSYLRDDELALPPGFVSSYPENERKF